MRGFITAWGGEHDRRNQFTSFQVGEERGCIKRGEGGGRKEWREGEMRSRSLMSVLAQ